MSTEATDQIADKAALRVLNARGIKIEYPNEIRIETLAWEIANANSGVAPLTLLRELVAEAIKLDRERRGIIELVAETLDDREADAAAQLVRDTDPDDDLWNNYIGPMIDSIETDYTRAATEGS